MKSFFKRCAAILTILFVFAGTLELMSYALQKMDFQPQLPVLNLRYSEWSQLPKELQSFPERFPEIKVRGTFDFSDPPVYKLSGIKSGTPLFHKIRLSPNLDDDFILKGQSGKVKYNVHYKTDSVGRRVTSFTPEKNQRSNLIFIGCSFTMGEGVHQDEIFPSLIAKEYPKTKVLNFGVGGTSPAKELHAMTIVPSEYFRDTNTSIPTYAVWTYIDDHMRRIVATSEYLSRSPHHINEPHSLLRDNQLLFEGTHKDHFWSLRWLLEGYGQTRFAKVTRFELPVISDYHLRLTARIFAGIQDQFRKAYPQFKGLIVTSYPANGIYFEKLKVLLEAEGIKVFDFSGYDIDKLLNGNDRMATDPHPTKFAHAFYSEILQRELKTNYPEL